MLLSSQLWPQVRFGKQQHNQCACSQIWVQKQRLDLLHPALTAMFRVQLEGRSDHFTWIYNCAMIDGTVLRSCWFWNEYLWSFANVNRNSKIIAVTTKLRLQCHQHLRYLTESKHVKSFAIQFYPCSHWWNLSCKSIKMKLNQNNGVSNRYLCLFDKYHQGYLIPRKSMWNLKSFFTLKRFGWKYGWKYFVNVSYNFGRSSNSTCGRMIKFQHSFFLLKGF